MNSRLPVKNSPSQLTGLTDGFESRSVMNKFVAEFDKYKNQLQTMSPSQREEADAWAIERALKDNYPQFRPGQSSKSSEKSASAEQQIMEESVAAQRYQAIAKLLKESGLQEGSTDWGKAVVQVSIGTELDIAEVKDIAKEIPGLKPSQAEGLVDSFQSSNQLEFV
jgi:hypothetical protein